MGNGEWGVVKLKFALKKTNKRQRKDKEKTKRRKNDCNKY
jgi:hypothetical protein